MNVVKSLELTDPIIFTRILPCGELIVVDAKTTIKFFSKDELELISGLKVNIHHKDYKNSVISFSLV